MAAEYAFSLPVLLLVKLYYGKTNKTVMCHAEPGVQDSKNSVKKEESASESAAAIAGKNASSV